MASENFQEDPVPTAEVEEFLKEPSGPSGAAAEPGQSQPNEEENRTQDFVPFETKLWRYCLRDSSDEIFWGLVFLAVWLTYFVGQWFGIREQQMVGIAYNTLTIIFAIGILYYSVFLFNPFKIFSRKKNGTFDPNANHWCYDLIVFIFFVTSVLVFADRVILTLTIPKEAKSNTELALNNSEAAPGVEAETSEPAAEASEPVAEASEPVADASEPVEEASEKATPSTEATADKKEVESVESEVLGYTLGIYRQVIYTLFSVFVIGNMVYLLVELFFARICTYYQLSPVLFTMKTGFFITKERRIAVWDIAQVNMNRNLWQRFLRVGTIELKIHSHGMDGAQVSDESLKRNARILYLKGLSDPKTVQDDINHYRLFVRNHMGNRFINTITNDQSIGGSDE